MAMRVVSVLKTLCLCVLLLPTAATESRSVFETLASIPELSHFLELVEATNKSNPSSAAIMALFRHPTGGNGVTVLAPNNAAFGKFALLVGGQPPQVVMSQILAFHVLPEIVNLTQTPTEKATFLQNQSLSLSDTMISATVGSGGAPLSSAVPIKDSFLFNFGTIVIIESVLRPLFEVQDFMRQQEHGQQFWDQLAELSEAVGASGEEIEANSEAIDANWMLICAFLVFFMQAGFAMYETGSIPAFSTRNVLFKNMLDSTISSIGWWIMGFSISYNEPENSPLMGSANFFASDYCKFHYLIFGWGFCATTATIDSGATIGRIKLPVYLAMNFVSGWILYPFFSHWVWGGGFLAHFGFIDFAGSGVIHMTGGTCGLIAAVLLGPRKERWYVNEKGQKVENFIGSSTALLMMGTFILFFCWFGFNCGSSMAVTGGHWKVAATAGINTFLAPSASVVTMLLFNIYFNGTYSIEDTCNAILSGLVAITGSCATSSAVGALTTGVISVGIYKAVSKLMVRLEIDDPVDVVAVHGANGTFGVIAVAIFSTEDRLIQAGFPVRSFGRQLLAQLVGIACIMLTAGLIMFVLLITLKHTMGIRVNELEEKVGLDFIYHGSSSSFQDKVRAHTQQMEREKEMVTLQEKRDLDKLNSASDNTFRRKLRAATKKLETSRSGSGGRKAKTGSQTGDTKSKTNSDSGSSREDTATPSTLSALGSSNTHSVNTATASSGMQSVNTKTTSSHNISNPRSS